MRPFQTSKIPLPRVRLADVKKVPGNFSNLDIEIGCGVGLHSVNYAIQNPQRTLVAIDKSGVRFAKMEGRIKEVGKVPNLVPIRENAVWFVAHEIKPDSVENYFFLYPNPYPKKSQANKRWPRMPFMQHVLATLKKKGLIHLATNMRYYADDAEEFFTKEWGLKLIMKQKYSSIDECPFTPRTHFEKKYLQRGETCWNLVFEKRF
jgi:tRNA (guanine-N7-)-methyltransferase